MAVGGEADPVAAAEKRRMTENDLRRHDAVTDQMLWAVEVGQEGVEDPQSLPDALLDPPPVVGGDHERDRVEDPGPLSPFAIVVDVVGHAVVADQPAGLLPPRGELGRAPAPQNGGQPSPVRSGFAALRKLVMSAGGDAVRGERIDRTEGHGVGDGHRQRALGECRPRRLLTRGPAVGCGGKRPQESVAGSGVSRAEKSQRLFSAERQCTKMGRQGIGPSPDDAQPSSVRSSSSTSWPNRPSAVATGSGRSRSTPASRRSSSGHFEQPPRRKPR